MKKTNLLLLLLMNAGMLTHVAAEETDLPLSGPAYEMADAAYKSYAKGDYAKAAEQAREAVRLRPDVARLKQLLTQAEASQKSQQQAIAAARKPASAATPANNPAYIAADKGYKAYNKKDYVAAIDHAQHAVRLAPANSAYWTLLINSQLAAQRFDEADQTVTQALQRFGPRSSFAQERVVVNQNLANAAGTQIYQALDKQNYAQAIDAAQRAVKYAPERRVYRLLLVQSLLGADRLDEASQALEPLLQKGNDPVALTWHGYIRQRQGQRAAATADFEQALTLRGSMTTEDMVNLRLIIADTDLYAGEPDAVLKVLESLDGNAAVASRKRSAAELRLRRASQQQIVSSQVMPPPVLRCRGEMNAEVCGLMPGSPPPDPAYASADAAYKALASNDYPLALSQTRAALQKSPGNPAYQLLLVNILSRDKQLEAAEREATLAIDGGNRDPEMLAQRGRVREALGKKEQAEQDYKDVLQLGTASVPLQINMLSRLHERKEASRRYNAAEEAGVFDGMPKVEQAYVAASAGESKRAFSLFDQADQEVGLPPAAIPDTAYAALSARRDPDASKYFRRTVDAVDKGDIALTLQQLFETRRAIADIERTWGATASLNYRGASLQPGSGITPSGTNNSAQIGGEVYWRPFGYRSGRPIEIYASVFETVYNKNNAVTGAPTAQGGIGIRWKPFSETNFIMALQRQIKIGSASGEGDWIARLAYSNSFGTDLRVDQPSWWTGQIFGEVGRYIDNKQTYSVFEGQLGRTYRLDNINPKLTITPHVVIGSDFNSSLKLPADKTAIGMGPGVSMRYWFREDHYKAPQSYVDFSLQYRFKLSGDDRAEGVVFRTTLAY
ncbi:bacteriophage N4 adsorption protein A [Herminiimonas contaminans]|uniref:Bacteriophage N4 adsorption protein A C-terminal domain-containing protein n=1 Tax=Herminiimonas contaminans TaxID=1111140 RepID=A0ABS0EW33_9BURK|nr:bacteriophage N4 adsorption protein A [Herminiimonas contaminans]MBF8179046.1 hypothetical protein [Herminiimonas contaminans]